MNKFEAVGYMLIACKNVGLSEENTEKVFQEMYRSFDIFKEEHAEFFFRKWYEERIDSKKNDFENAEWII